MAFGGTGIIRGVQCYESSFISWQLLSIINHCILLDCFKEIGRKALFYSGSLSYWFKPNQWWLEKRNPNGYFLFCEDKSLFFPVPFNIYMKPPVDIICQHETWYHQYVNDTQLYISSAGHTDGGSADSLTRDCHV